MADTNNTNEKATQQESQEKIEQVYLTFNEKFCQENVQPKNPEGTQYNRVTLPTNTVIDGKDYGGYSFYPYYVNKENKFENRELVRDEQGHPVQDENSYLRSVPVPKNKPVQLSFYDRQTKEVTKAEVNAEKLDKALRTGYKQYKQKEREDFKKADKTYIRVHKTFVKENIARKDGSGTFNAVDLAKGTIIDGKDYGGYSFYPDYVNKENKFENGELVRDEQGRPVQDENSDMRQIPLVANKPVKLSRKDQETGQKIEVEVEPAKLQTAIKEQRAQYIDNLPNKKEEVGIENESVFENVAIDDKPMQQSQKGKIDLSAAKMTHEQAQSWADEQNAKLDKTQDDPKKGLKQ